MQSPLYKCLANCEWSRGASLKHLNLKTFLKSSGQPCANPQQTECHFPMANRQRNDSTLTALLANQVGIAFPNTEEPLRQG